MMPMHLPYAINNPVGHYFYGTTVYPNIPANYNPYFPSFCSNSNGLLPTPPQLLQRLNAASNRTINNPGFQQTISPNSMKTVPLASSLIINKEKNKTCSNDCQTLPDSQMKTFSVLNPFANEFSLEKMNNNTNQNININNRTINFDQENNSSSRLVFDNLIEQSLQSIDIIRKTTKSVSVKHVSTQIESTINQVHCATQANENSYDHELLKEYSARTIGLMDALSAKFQCLLVSPDENNLHDQLKSIGHILDELRYFSLEINQIITSNNSSIDRDSVFSDMMEDFSVRSSLHTFGVGRGSSRSTLSSRIHSFIRLQQMEPKQIVRSKICMICQKPIDDADEAIHELCRLLSSPPDI